MNLFYVLSPSHPKICSPSTLSSNVQSAISKIPYVPFLLQGKPSCELCSPLGAACFVSQGSTALGLQVEHVSSLLLIAAFRQFSNPPAFLTSAIMNLSSYYITSDSSLLLLKHQGSSSFSLPNPPTHSHGQCPMLCYY